MERRSVLVLGGGVAGMSAAHELAERGFAVTVLERRTIPGGKARSMPVPNTGTGGRRDLPAEHGFRFFPGFYRHLPDTMKRIPVPEHGRSVFDNLVPATRLEMCQNGLRNVTIPARFPTSVEELRMGLGAVIANFTGDPGIPPLDVAHFVERLITMLRSCEARRYVEYENLDWWTFSGADRRSAKYQLYLADGLSRTLVAAQARRLSARAGGYILVQLLLDLMRPGGRTDRLLCGPTNDVWIAPWLRHLRSLGVDYRMGAEVRAIASRNGRVTGVRVLEGGSATTRTADLYVAAVPKEVMQRLVTPALRREEPLLAGLSQLETRWMNGIMFYMREDASTVRGHCIYIDSPWALTSISQQQFWPDYDCRTMGDGSVSGILSVDVSEWEAPGELVRKHAKDCSRDEFVAEVRHQLRVRGVEGLDDSNLVTTFVDTDITFPNPRHAGVNAEPLLVNTSGSWQHRPRAVTAVGNLFLASDYVRTHTDLATMEAANEAARRAVNGILDACGSAEPRCGVWPLSEPAFFAPARLADRVMFGLGRAMDGGAATAGLASLSAG
ncbi:MAG TPA: FAD-dependent oxidoreductase [Candidatus Dormibacteraeota bacterium]|nr:FAD-dependent oxidoreductase [Candidatus Dormibacteraeota bacterium]